MSGDVASENRKGLEDVQAETQIWIQRLGIGGFEQVQLWMCALGLAGGVCVCECL